METVFYQDHQIREQIDQVIQSIAAVELLSGKDTGNEFIKGRQFMESLIKKLQLLQIDSDPILLDAINQLIEQRLPAEQHINEISQFEEIKNRMFDEGIKLIRSITPEENRTAIAALTQNILFQADRIEQLDEFSGEQAVSSQETVNHREELPQFNKPDTQFTLKRNNLHYIINRLFPQEEIHWDVCLNEKIFIVQVKHLLLYVIDSFEEDHDLESIEQKEWQIIKIHTEDLLYPKRIERIIKQHRHRVSADRHTII